MISLEQHEHPAKISLWDTLENTPLEKGYRPDRERQKTVFERIHWDTFLPELKKESGGTADGAGKRLRGKLFEMLIQADPAFGERSPLEKELLALAHNPKQFGLEKELGTYRNPDMAFLLTHREDGIIIEGIGESKLGLLNERSFKQLSETGFARGVKALVEVVNGIKDPEAYGLIEIARAKAQLAQGKALLTVANDFNQLLVVPANRNTDWSSTLINRREFSAQGRQAFYEMLEDTSRVVTKRAAFSTAEVAAMAKKVASVVQ